jgi:glutamate synthase (NADPH/NADH) large chain
MSGGVVYVRHAPERGIDERAIRDRLAKGAKVTLRPPNEEDRASLDDLLRAYAGFLAQSGQDATETLALLDDPDAFRAIRPGTEIVEQSVSTE